MFKVDEVLRTAIWMVASPGAVATVTTLKSFISAELSPLLPELEVVPAWTRALRFFGVRLAVLLGAWRGVSDGCSAVDEVSILTRLFRR